MQKKFYIFYLLIYISTALLNASEFNEDFSKNKTHHNSALQLEQNELILSETNFNKNLFSNLLVLQDGKFRQKFERKPSDKECLNLLSNAFQAFTSLSILFQLKIKKQYYREPTAQELNEIYSKIDTILRTKIFNGDYELDLTDDLEKGTLLLENN